MHELRTIVKLPRRSAWVSYISNAISYSSLQLQGHETNARQLGRAEASGSEAKSVALRQGEGEALVSAFSSRQAVPCGQLVQDESWRHVNPSPLRTPRAIRTSWVWNPPVYVRWIQLNQQSLQASATDSRHLPQHEIRSIVALQASGSKNTMSGAFAMRKQGRTRSGAICRALQRRDQVPRLWNDETSDLGSPRHR